MIDRYLGQYTLGESARCNDCGTIVIDADTHNGFHDRVERLKDRRPMGEPMSDHKPECPMLDQQWPKHPLEVCEYCDMIAACEQRVRQSAATLWDRNSEQMAAARVEGIRAGLDAAREAVEALDIGRDVRFSVDVKADALAAIDALRESK